MIPPLTPAPLTVDAIRDCLEGIVPSTIATCDAAGVPNASLLSQVHYVDSRHVALTYQFFNKTRRNILDNPYAAVQVTDPVTAREFRLFLRYLSTETSGPLFESMKAKLAGIASHAGMQDIFVLRGADLYRVLEVEAVPGEALPAPPRRNLLPDVRRTCERLSACADLHEVLDQALALLGERFAIDHAMILMGDETGERLYTVASRGYPASGAGFEVGLGDGVIGVAARERVPIRICHLTSEYTYTRAAGTSAGTAPAKEIPFPGLEEPHSQIAVPIIAGPRLLGVLFAESGEDLRFCYEDEDALATIAAHLGGLIPALAQAATANEAPAGDCCPVPTGVPAVIRHYAADDSVFIDHDYLIKGVAGAIFRKLVRDHVTDGRCEFTNRELRLAPDIRLPEVAENLEARLLLLQRRLADRSDVLRIERTGRGRFRLEVARPLVLEEMA